MISDDVQQIQTNCTVATDGSSGGNGILTNPLSLSSLMNISASIWPGVTIQLRSGTYSGDFTSQLSGNPHGRITVEPYPGETVRLHGSIYFHADYVTLRSIEVYDADFVTRESAETGSGPGDIPVHDGFKCESSSAKMQFINCIIHDCRQGMLVNSPNLDIEIYGCVIFYNGWTAQDRGHGHGIYAAQDQGGSLTVKDCIIFSQFGWGVHCYGSPPAQLYGITVEGCTVFNNGILANTHYDNILVGGSSGTWPVTPVIKDNCCYFLWTNVGNCLKVGFGLGGSTDARISGNVLVGGAYALYMDHMWGTPPTITNNSFYGTASIEGYTQADYPDNTYASGIPDLATVRANQYDANRANLTIYNGSGSDAVTVDVSAVFQAGNTIRVRNVQDYFNDLQSVIVAGDGTLTVNMQAANRTIAAPQGWNAPPTTFPQFGCFVLERT